MSARRPIARAQEEKAITTVSACWSQAFGCLHEPQLPHWKRVQNALLCFKGMPADHIPPKLARRIDRVFGGVNTVLARYPIKTWDDYQMISPDDLTKIESLIINLL